MYSQATTFDCHWLIASSENLVRIRRRRTRSFMCTVLLSFIVLLAMSSTSFAQAALSDDADTQNGHAPNLTLNGGSNVYLKFKLTTTLPTNTPGSSVSRATIKLYLGAVKSPGIVDVFQLISHWSEQTIASTAPILGNQLQAGIPLQSDQEGQFLVIDITPAVQQWLGTDGLGGGGVPNFGVALVARNGASLSIDSKENAQTSHEPQLNILLERGAGTLTGVSADAPLSVTNPTTAPHISLGVVPADKGGTGLSASGAAGNFLRSDGNAWTSGPLLAPDIPPGSEHYIQNSSNPQAATNFNIGGTGTADILNAATQFNLGGSRVLSQPRTNNLFAGNGAGAANTGQSNSFFGNSAGLANLAGNFNAFFGSGSGRANTGGSNNSFFGSSAGLANTTGFQNSFFGREAGISNTQGSFNSFFGRSAGLFNTTGSGNNFFGQDSGILNTTGGTNAFFAIAAGQANTTGSSNSFFGAFAGDANTTGSNNTIIGAGADVGANNLDHATAIGAGAVVSTSNTVALGRGVDTVQVPGALNVSGALGANILNAATQFNLGGSRILGNAGNRNLFAGINAGLVNTGPFNSFFGDSAGLSNTTGGLNSFFGTNAGQQNTTGGFNSFFGEGAGQNNITGGSNSFFGTAAGNKNSTGTHNSFFGQDSGFANTTGASNSFFGVGAGALNTTGGQNSFFGTGTGLSNHTGFFNSFFGGQAGNNNTTGQNNSFLGFNAGSQNTTGNRNAFFGMGAGDNNTTGNNNTLIGVGADVVAENLNNATAIGANAQVSQSNSLVLGNGASVGIGTTAPKAKLEVTGGNILVGSPGQGIILKSPDGAACRLLSIDNAGDLTLVTVPCP